MELSLTAAGRREDKEKFIVDHSPCLFCLELAETWMEPPESPSLHTSLVITDFNILSGIAESSVLGDDHNA